MSKKIYDLDTTLLFGKKHHGEAIEDIIDNDVQFITWCIDTIEGFELDNEAFEYYQKILEET
jgi:hypothetical protein